MRQLEKISIGEVRQAYLYLTHHAAALLDYECRPQNKGVIDDFRYYHHSEWPFAFIVNQKSLLWYFRIPGLRHQWANVAKLAEQFAEVKEVQRGEITVRISDLNDAIRIAELTFGGRGG